MMAEAEAARTPSIRLALAAAVVSMDFSMMCYSLKERRP
jgi:hypothetical protein